MILRMLPLAVTALLLTILTIAPAAASSADTAAEDSHPQRLVAVEDTRRLNLFCLGQGSPTVLLESGSGGSTADWWRIQDRLGQITRTCAYDRAGYGYSDPARRPSDAAAAVDDLHRLIVAAHLGPRPILVGHSNGGIYATLFAERYPGELAGLVLVDPGFPGQQDYARYGLPPGRIAALRHWRAGLIDGARVCLSAVKRDGPGLTTDHPDCLATPPEDPAILRAALRDLYSRVPYEAANLSEFENSFGVDPAGATPDDKEFPRPLHTLGDLPLIVLTADHHPVPVPGFTALETARYWTVWKQGHDRLARLSTAGESRVVTGSGHFIQNDKPEAVLAAVGAIVSTVRGHRSGP
ncbi:alpha/beta fold hydrolase [Lichenicola sp.]|uniref:alpha/beta fold hydrolase n=1 Tax=Lichenicola sp. TaxID=2804529 RepID=UPI003B0051DE